MIPIEVVRKDVMEIEMGRTEVSGDSVGTGENKNMTMLETTALPEKFKESRMTQVLLQGKVPVEEAVAAIDDLQNHASR